MLKTDKLQSTGGKLRFKRLLAAILIMVLLENISVDGSPPRPAFE